MNKEQVNNLASRIYDRNEDGVRETWVEITRDASVDECRAYDNLFFAILDLMYETIHEEHNNLT